MAMGDRLTASAPSTLALVDAPRVKAPDGSAVDVLLRVRGGSMARFSLPPGGISAAVVHRTVDELWYVIEGTGEMWRAQGHDESIVALAPGVCLSLPVGTSFQFRASAAQGLAAIAVTMPPWPGDDEAQPVAGPWVSS